MSAALLMRWLGGVGGILQRKIHPNNRIHMLFPCMTLSHLGVSYASDVHLTVYNHKVYMCEFSFWVDFVPELPQQKQKCPPTSSICVSTIYPSMLSQPWGILRINIPFIIPKNNHRNNGLLRGMRNFNTRISNCVSSITTIQQPKKMWEIHIFNSWPMT